MSRKIGMILFIFSFVLYGLILVVPVLPISNVARGGVVATLIIVGEIAFWVGGVLLGKELVRKYRKWLNPLNWFKKRQPKQEGSKEVE